MNNRYVTKLREVDAIQWTGSNLDDVTLFVGNHGRIDMYAKLYISIFSGNWMGSCEPGWFIVKENDGRLTTMPAKRFFVEFEGITLN